MKRTKLWNKIWLLKKNKERLAVRFTILKSARRLLNLFKINEMALCMIDFIRFLKKDIKSKLGMLLILLKLRLTYLLILSIRKPHLLQKLIKSLKKSSEIDQYKNSYMMMQSEDNLNKRDKAKLILIWKRKRRNQKFLTQILNTSYTNSTENSSLFMSRYLEFVQRMSHKMNL